jgi:hypothetical protein
VAGNGRQENVHGSQPSRGWIGYFIVLAFLAVAAVCIPLWYNLSQQLDPGELEAARKLWAEKGPASYDLEYTKKGSVNGKFLVQVRNGKVLSVTLDGQPLEPRLYPYYDMGGLLDDVGRFLELDRTPGSPRTFVTAKFDKTDGHLIHYIRSVTSTRQRLEIACRLTPVNASPD